MNILQFREVIIDHLWPKNRYTVIYRQINMFFNHISNQQECPVNDARNAIKICPRKSSEIMPLTL